jgi:hypothetical protein
MDAGHGCSNRSSVDVRVVRLLSHLVGIIRLPYRVGRLQGSKQTNPLPGAIFVSLRTSIAFTGVRGFA